MLLGERGCLGCAEECYCRAPPDPSQRNEGVTECKIKTKKIRKLNLWFFIRRFILDFDFPKFFLPPGSQNISHASQKW